MTRTKGYSTCVLGLQNSKNGMFIFALEKPIVKRIGLKTGLKSKHGYQLSRRKPLPQNPVAEEAKDDTYVLHTLEWVYLVVCWKLC